jgi:hypothetical protein
VNAELRTVFNWKNSSLFVVHRSLLVVRDNQTLRGGSKLSYLSGSCKLAVVNDFEEQGRQQSWPAAGCAPQPLTAVEPPLSPDNPPWGAGAGLGVWLASVTFLVTVPLVAVVPYFVYQAAKGVQFDAATAASDPKVIALSLAGTIPAHLLTLLVAWAVVTGWRKRPFAETVGWRVAGWQEWVGCAMLGLGLFFLAGVILHFFGSEQETELERILQSSPAARYVGAFLAAVTAPATEELVYRGVLFSGLKKATNTALAIALVTFLFALVHVQQYSANPAVIGVILLLSLTLTTVRATTGRLLPCVVIHTVFNGVQAVLLAAGIQLEKTPEAAPQPGFIVHALAQLFT